MVRSAKTTASWLAIVMLITLTTYTSQSPRAASLGGSAHRCAGCATGNCVPRSATYGHYRTIWRRWPIPSPLADRGGPRETHVPDVEVPGAVDEGRTRPRSRAAESPSDGKSSESPRTLGMPAEANDDPFRTRPESEAPDLEALQPSDDTGGAFDIDLSPETGGFGDLELDNDDNSDGENPNDDNPINDLPGLPTFDDPADDLPFNGNLRRTPKRLELNLTGDRQFSHAGLTIVPPINAHTSPSPAPHVTIEASSNTSAATDALPFSPDDLVIPPESPRQQQTAVAKIDQVVYQTIQPEPPLALGLHANPLRPHRQLRSKSPNQKSVVDRRQEASPPRVITSTLTTKRQKSDRKNPLRSR